MNVRYRRALTALLAFLMCSALSAFPVEPTKSPDISAYSHIIKMKSRLQAGHCTATAIGPYTLLTASHCENPSELITVDHTVTTILALQRDGNDHTILYLALDRPFKRYAPVSLVPRPRGTVARIVGNPGDGRQLLRSGEVSGKSYDEDEDISSDVFSFRAGAGDSGGGIFDATGTVFDVLSAIQNMEDDDNPLWMPVAYPLAFTEADLLSARVFDPTKAHQMEFKGLSPLYVLKVTK